MRGAPTTECFLQTVNIVPNQSYENAYLFFQTLHVHDLLGLWLYTYILDGKTLTYTLNINFHKDFSSASMMLKLTQTGGDTY